jgi:hypothetical protein
LKETKTENKDIILISTAIQTLAEMIQNYSIHEIEFNKEKKIF